VSRAAPLVALLTLTAACGDFSTQGWVPIAHDSMYQIAIDTSRLETPSNHAFVIAWFRTDHARTHLYKGQPFNREIVESYLRCGDLSFKVVRVDMSLRGRPATVQQRSGPTDLDEQSWRHVARGTIEALAAQRTCDIAHLRASSLATR
jgi:hypothetical protein